MEIQGGPSFTVTLPHYHPEILRRKATELAQQAAALFPGSAPLPKPDDQLVFARQRLTELRSALEALNLPLQASQIRKAQAASATSAADIGLGSGPATAAVLQSTEEVNTTATSFSPFGPDFTGASTAQATIGGIYDGSNGTGTLTFRVQNGGTHGVDNLQIKVFDPLDAQIDVININQSDPLNTAYTLANGLTLTLGAGDLIKDDEFTIQVFDSVGSVVDPAKPFNGTRNQNPNFENGLSVTAGSFQVNGETITVLANDTINSVLSTINQSNAGVTATFDAVTEKVVLTQNTLGATPTITLANDSSGFLAATKLSGATPVPGIDGGNGPDQHIEDVSAFSSVQTGSILINGVTIAIDVQTDSLNDVLTRITNSAANVQATLTGGEQRVSLVANKYTNSLVLDSNGTGFFGAVGITDGTFNPIKGVVHRNGLSRSGAKEFTTVLRDVADALNPIFNDAKLSGRPGTFLTQLRTNLQKAILGAFDAKQGQVRTDFGIEFNFGTSDIAVFRFDREQLLSALDRRLDQVKEPLLGNGVANKVGLVDRVLGVIQQAESELDAKLGSTGLFVDLRA